MCCVQSAMTLREFSFTLAVRFTLLAVLLGVVGGISYGATHWEPRVADAGTSTPR